MITTDIAEIFATVGASESVAVMRTAKRSPLLHDYIFSAVEGAYDRLIVFLGQDENLLQDRPPHPQDFSSTKADYCLISGYRLYSSSPETPLSKWDNALVTAWASYRFPSQIEPEWGDILLCQMKTSMYQFPYSYKYVLAMEPFVGKYNITFIDPQFLIYKHAVETNQREVFPTHFMENRYKAVYAASGHKFFEMDLIPRSFSGETIQDYITRVTPVIRVSGAEYGTRVTDIFSQCVEEEIVAFEMPLTFFPERVDKGNLITENTVMGIWFIPTETRKGHLWMWRPAVPGGSFI